MLRWNEGDDNGTCLLGYLNSPLSLEKTVAILRADGAVDEGPGDKTCYEFVGTWHGAVFTLYDYKGGGDLHIGGYPPEGTLFPVENDRAVDVPSLRRHLHALLADPRYADVPPVPMRVYDDGSTYDG